MSSILLRRAPLRAMTSRSLANRGGGQTGATGRIASFHSRTMRPVISTISNSHPIRMMATKKDPIVKYEELKPRTEQPTGDFYLIDVRESHEVEQGSIPSATVLPLTVLPSAIVLPPDQFLKTYGFEKPGKNKEIIFYCRSGKRAATACETARNNGYTNVRNYEGSWLDWIEREQGSSGSSPS